MALIWMTLGALLPVSAWFMTRRPEPLRIEARARR
ncbi:hypothetical protein PAYE108092_01735 [Paracoccus yeei]|jgi:hypothetical protein